MRKRWVYFILFVAIAAAALGLKRLRFDTDILSMLPQDMPEVRGLKDFMKVFDRDDEAVLVLQDSRGNNRPLAEAAASLSKQLEKDGVVKEARWRPRLRLDSENPQEGKDAADLLAYLWLNSDPEEVKAFAGKFAPGKSEAFLKEALERISTADLGADMVMQAHDPYGFLEHPAVTSMISSMSDGGGGFLSADGTAHLLFASAPHPVRGYREAAAWLKTLRASIGNWNATEEGRDFKVTMTGQPVFSSEIGTAMEYDLNGTIGITLTLIAILFWWMQRRLMLLAGLTVILTLVFIVALGIAGWMYGEISIIALSSAEILIGLATDYGLVICQEAKLAGHDQKALLHASGRPVLCGALTTTVVFMALNLGGLPGMAQLGTIVAVGLGAAGILMIFLYLPWVVKYGVDRQSRDDEPRWLPRKKKAWIITGVLSVISFAILGWKGMPGAEFDTKIMRPRNSQAMVALEKVQEKFPEKDPRMLKVVVEGQDDASMVARIREAQARLDSARASGVLTEATLPAYWWPDPARQAENRKVFADLAAQSPRLLAEADAAGFNEQGTGLGKVVFASLAEWTAKDALVVPKSPAAQEIMGLYMSRKDDGSGYFLGSVLPSKEADPDSPGYSKLRALNGDGIYLSSWSLLKPAIGMVVKDDLVRMLIPMGLLLIGMMAFIFRRFRDVWFAIFTMIIGTLVMLATMSLLGMKWNFVNLMATPLLLGTGIDYAIHVTLTLRRTGSCFKEFWNGTGKALLFCGASNLIGFGSMCFSSSDALDSLGNVSIIGILVSMLGSLFLLPGWHEEKGNPTPERQ
jgi:predicted RND superfamily exporter protein